MGENGLTSEWIGQLLNLVHTKYAGCGGQDAIVILVTECHIICVKGLRDQLCGRYGHRGIGARQPLTS